MNSSRVLSSRTVSGEIRPMTGVHGIAALAVVAYHYFDHAGVALRPWQHAYLVVDLFFMLSGLVLALNYALSVTLGAGCESYVAFVKKRIARVFPLYIAVTFIQTLYDLSKHVLLGLLMPVTWNLKAMLANMFLVQAWGISHSVVMPAWSLRTEFAAYVLFPVLVALAIGSRAAMAWCVSALMIFLLMTAATGGHDCSGYGGYLNVIQGDELHPLMRCIAGFTFGLLAYRLVSRMRVGALASPATHSRCSQ
ncbi:putative MEMBRANE ACYLTRANSFERASE [Candidatus Paraburkholderia calva]|nr:putative MEMBRANE ACYLTRANSFERASE [Candidatus Paraburkholderia calva]